MVRLIIASLFLLWCLACNTNQSSNANQPAVPSQPVSQPEAQPIPEPEPAPRPVGLRDEAVKHFNVWFAQKFTECGEFHYNKYFRTIFEMQLVVVPPVSIDLTNLEKMNGYEFKSEAIVLVRLYRMIGSVTGTTGDWQEGNKLIISVEKRKGNWEVDPNNGVLQGYEKVKCSEIPKH